MENIEFNEEYLKVYKVGDWTVSCSGRRFKINNNGIKLFVREDEELEKILFDVDKKTVSVKVKNPTLSEKVPRVLDLSNDIEFFEALRKDLEMILTTKWGKFTSVIPNEDRTNFEVS